MSVGEGGGSDTGDVAVGDEGRRLIHGNYWKTQRISFDQAESLETALDIPYIRDQFKDQIKALQDDAGVDAELTYEQMYDSLTPSQKETVEMITEKDVLVKRYCVENRESEKKCNESKLIKRIRMYMNDVSDRAMRIEGGLLYISSLSQAETDQATIKTIGNGIEGSINTKIAVERRKMIGDASPKRFFSSPKELVEEIKEEEEESKFPAYPKPRFTNKLKVMADWYNETFFNSSVLVLDATKNTQSDTKDYGRSESKSRPNKTVGAAAESGQPRPKKRRKSAESIDDAKISLEKEANATMDTNQQIKDSASKLLSGLKDPDKKLDGLAFPPPQAMETEDTQPIFSSILQAVSHFCTSDHYLFSPPESPSPDHPTTQPPAQSPPKSVREHLIVPGEDRTKRDCDMALYKRGRLLAYHLDGQLSELVELKPILRSKKGPLALRDEAMNQVSSHMAKSLLYWVNYGNGAGVSSVATAVIATLAYVEVIRFRMCDVGTPHASLKVCRSGPLPLIKKETFEMWIGQGTEKPSETCFREIEVLKEMLYKRSGDSQGEEHYSGWELLYGLMQASRSDLMDPAWDKLFVKPPQLDFKMIGSGSFGVVVMVASKGDSTEGPRALKISKFNELKTMENEVAILHHLWKDSEQDDVGRNSLPFLVASGFVTVNIGGVEFKNTAMLTTPVGENIHPRLWGVNRPRRNQIVRDTYNGVLDALNYVHSRGISHNDVNDRNIVLVKCEKNVSGFRAILIDFGISSQLNGLIVGFQGSPSFAHRNIHNHCAKWCPVADYDKTSLGFVLAVILNDRIMPWPGLNGREVEESKSFDERFDEARKVLVRELKDGKDEPRDDDHEPEDGDDQLFNNIEELINLDKKGVKEYHRACRRLKGCTQRCGCCRHGLKCSALCACFDAETGESNCRRPEDQRRKLENLEFPRGMIDKDLWASLAQAEGEELPETS